MLLSNILITDPEAGPVTDLPPVLKENIAAMRSLHPSLEYRMFHEAEVIELIETHFDRSVLDAYLQLRPLAFRADIARYCILFHYGGLYVDLSYFLVHAIPLTKRPVVFRGNLISAPWDTSNAIIYAPPRHGAIKCALALACANVRRRYYGATALCPTGPALFGKALAMTCEAEELIAGTARLVRPEVAREQFPNVALPDDDYHHIQTVQGVPYAIKRKPMLSGGLSGLGLRGTNDYREIWKAREVYI
jgi:mannosyltransferase OCH1-like enzyme